MGLADICSCVTSQETCQALWGDMLRIGGMRDYCHPGYACHVIHIRPRGQTWYSVRLQVRFVQVTSDQGFCQLLQTVIPRLEGWWSNLRWFLPPFMLNETYWSGSINLQGGPMCVKTSKAYSNKFYLLPWYIRWKFTQIDFSCPIALLQLALLLFQIWGKICCLNEIRSETQGLPDNSWRQV